MGENKASRGVFMGILDKRNSRLKINLTLGVVSGV